MALKFPAPTDEEKIEWANADTIDRAEFGGHVYERSSTQKVFILTRTSAAPDTRKTKSGFLELVGVNHSPSEALLGNIKQASQWL